MSLFRFFKTAGFSKIFAPLILCASCALSLNASPNEELVRSLFSDANFDKNLYFKGEMRSYLKRKFYAADNYSEITVAPLGRSDEFSEIFHVFLGSTEKHFDLYVYTKEDGIYAVRVLAQTAIIEAIVSEYEKFSEAQKREFEQRTDADIVNLKLILAPDKELMEFGKQNLSAFEKIYELYASGESERAKAEIKSLHLSHGETSGKNFMLLIGGVTDNSVGFLRVQDEADLPQMSPSEFIMIEKIAPNWYLFKTT